MNEETILQLKLLSENDVAENYLSWMQDPEVVQYLECRWCAHTMESLREYVKNVCLSPNDFAFAIFINNETHIGNVKIGNINWMHRFAEIGLLIGERSFRGRGLGTEVIRRATEYAFKELNINKLVAGIYSPNVASYKAFSKAGYREVGILKNHRFYKGDFVDEFFMEKGVSF